MNQMNFERRDVERVKAGNTVALMSADDEILAKLVDISPKGAQFEVASSEVEALDHAIDKLRLPGQPSLTFEWIWNIHDSFGVRFTAPETSVAPIVDAFLKTQGRPEA